MRRWLLRILVTVAALIVLVGVVVQIVLWTSIPKNLVVKQIEREMGLRIATDSLTTGWLGRSTLTNVSLGLPLSRESFLGVKTLKVKHTTLLGLLLGRAVSIDLIELDQPRIVVVQDASGQWNLSEVAELLARAGGGKTAEQAQQQGTTKLPDVKLIDGTVQITDNQKHTATLAPLTVDGHAEGALVWKYDMKIAAAVTLVGQVAPGGNWKHQVTLTARNLDALLKDWGIDSHGAEVGGYWQGQVSDGNVTGTLTLDHATAKSVPGAGDVAATGIVDVQSAGGAVTLRPRRIDLKTGNAALPNVWLAAGTIVKDDSGVHAQTMQVAALGGLAVLDGSFDPRTMAGDMQARWSGLALPNNMNHSGSLTAKLRMPFEGHPLINVDLVSQGSTSSGKWDAKMNLAGQGQSWQSIDWVLSAPALNWNGSRPIQLAQLVGHISQRWPSIELTDLSLPERPHLLSKAAANLSAEHFGWYFWLDAGGAASAAHMPVPINFSVNAWGDRTVYTLHELNLQAADASIWAGGYYDLRQPNPVNLDVYLTQSPQLAATAPVQGHIGGKFNLSGRLYKKEDNRFHPQLDISGNLHSSDLVVLDRPIGDIDLQLTGFVDNLDTKLETTEMALFQGKWKLAADYPTSYGGVALKVDVRDLPVEQLASFAKVKNVTGQISRASWRFQIPRFGGLDQIRLDSSYVLQDVNANGFTVDRVEANATLDNGVFKISPLTAKSGTGRMDGSVTLDLSNARHVLTDVKVDKWPYGTPGGALVLLSAKTKLDIDLQHQGASGPVSATVDMQVKNAELAHADLSADLRGRVLSVSKLDGKMLTGTFDGAATFNLDKPLEAQGKVQWYDVDAAALASISPALNGLGGHFSGTISIEPARDPRPLEPVRIDVNIAADDGHFKSIRIGDKGLVAVHAVAYANTDRAVLDHSDIHVADGVVHLWARAGRNLSSQAAEISLENVQLDQIAHLNPKQDKPMPGRLTGRWVMVGSGADLSKLLGKGRIALTETDLGNWGPVAALYNAMNIGKSSAPTGYGSVDLLFEQDQLRVTRLSFFNRGVDARGIFTVGPSVWNLPRTPISGQVVGTARPLKDSRISLLANFDQVFGALQSSLTPVSVFGTVENPQYTLGAVAEISNALRSVIVGDARSTGGP